MAMRFLWIDKKTGVNQDAVEGQILHARNKTNSQSAARLAQAIVDR